MTSLVMTLTETLRYRGAIGQWSWVLHRLTGLGVVLFLTLHVIDTSWAVFYPELYVEAILTYQSPLFTIGEFGLIFAVVYHALNGLRIIIMDYNPRWWKYQQLAANAVLIGTAVLLLPVFALMFGHVLNHYSDPNVFILPLPEVLRAQLPFAIGIPVAAIVALLLSGLYGLVAGNQAAPVTGKASGSRVERFWWSFMRISGLIILPLVFGHLAAMHILQGVFDLQVVHAVDNLRVVGTDAINVTGTAVEFVQDRWNFLVGGVLVWRVYDFALLTLVTVHGFNGLRYVFTDYVQNQTLKRALIYLCVIGAVALLVSGGGALLLGVDDTAVQKAAEALAHIEATHR
ncbi:MAG: succinate dehydrogenase, cytochrome b556 subunit [Phototrophicaceae bacterium]